MIGLDSCWLHTHAHNVAFNRSTKTFAPSQLASFNAVRTYFAWYFILYVREFWQDIQYRRLLQLYSNRLDGDLSWLTRAISWGKDGVEFLQPYTSWWHYNLTSHDLAPPNLYIYINTLSAAIQLYKLPRFHYIVPCCYQIDCSPFDLPDQLLYDVQAIR